MTSPNYQLPALLKACVFMAFAVLFNINAVYAQAPTITTHPSNNSVCGGSNTTFTIVATNTTSYQWQVSTNSGNTWSNVSNTGIYSGATTTTITLTGISSTYNSYLYRCIATGSTSPSATSNACTLTVTSLPTISSTTGGTVCAGTNGQVSAVASTGASVTWHSASTGGTLLGTGNTLTIPSASTNTTYYAGAVIGGVGGSDTIQTPYNEDNGQRGAMFDIVTNTAMTVTGFDVNLYTGTTADYYIYYKVGTHVGSENNSADWIPLDTVTNLTSAGHNIPTPMGFNIAVPLLANTRYAFYITNDAGGGTAYTVGTNVGNYLSGNGDVTIYEGVGKSFPFGLTFTVRNINATMYYTTATGCVSSTRTGATLTVNPQSTVTANPPNRSIASGNNTTFNITATGANSYQWQVSTNSGSTWSNVTNTGIYTGATTNTLSLTNATNSYNNYQYRCIATNSSSCADTSTGGILSITGTAPSISSQPTNSGICVGANTSFSITASGTSITYQWQVSTNGAIWNNVTNSGIYSGATTNTLSLTAVTSSYNFYQYRCVVTGSASPAATSNAATLTVYTAPSIGFGPPSRNICSGDNTTFFVTGSGTGYQWQVSTNNGSTWNNITNTGIYSGATTYLLSLTAATSAYNSYKYRCIVSGYCTPNDTSNVGTLTVNPTPSITTQPTNSTVCQGSNTSFTIYANNATGYQWQVSTNNGSSWSNLANTGIYSSASTNTLTLTAATAAYNSYQYRCIVSGACTPNDTSNTALLTVNSFSSITTQPSNSTIGAGSNTSFSVTAANATSYQWQVSANSGSTWNNVTNTGIYSGATTNTLSLTAATATSNTYQYRCIISGVCTPNVTSNAAILTVNSAPAITTQPTNSTICAGSNTSFNIVATNATSYQWQVSTNSGSTWNNVTNTGIYSGATTNTLSLTAATSIQNGYQYRCEVVGATTPNAISSTATLTINIAPTISNHPSNNTVCESGNTSFSITAANATSYQWQVSTNNGSIWSNISNAGIYSGATINTLTLIAATSAYNGYQYRCVVSGLCTPNATSNAATLTVNSAPSITAQPSNSTIGAGSNTSFSVTAANATGYQWQVSTNNGSTWNNVTNTGIYSGATTNTLTLTNATATYNTYQYRCIISGTCTPNATSNSATLTVNSAPAITTQPTNSTICESSNTSFNIAATNATSYRWQVSTNNGTTWSNVTNTGIYTGATTNTLSLTGTTSTQNGYQYRCEVIGATTPNAISNAATLTINIAPTISNHPSNVTVCETTNTSFSVTATNATGYQWQVSINSGSTWSNINNTGVYTNATTSTLNITGVLSTMNNYQYRCITTGNCSPSATSNAATITVNTSPTITTQPTNSTICTGANTTFTIVASGTALTYQWQINNGSGWNNISNSGIYSGATTNSLTLTAATSTVNSYQYRCIVSGTCTPSETSSAATLTINDIPAISTQPINTNVCSGGNTSISLVATGAGLTYQWQVNNGSTWSNVTNSGIYSGATTSILSLTGATSGNVSGYQYRCIVSGTCTPNVTSSTATLSINSILTVSSQPSNSIICAGTNTSFSVTASGTGLTYQWQVSSNSGSTWSNLTNTGIYSGTASNTLSLTGATNTVSGYQYRCAISSTCTAPTNSNAATLTINDAPAITTQPVNSTICDGTNTTFTISASGAGLIYQWQVNSGSGWNNVTNSGIYTGATSNTLSLSGASTLANGYQYRCIVSGTCTPNTTSGVATLSIESAPTITTQPINTTTCDGSNATFSVVASGAGLTYQWQVNSGSGWNNVTNSGIYTGATTNTLSLTGVTSSINTYQYRCIVSGTCTPNATSNVTTITINSTLTISTQPTNSTICSGNNTSFTISASASGLTYQWQVNTGSGWNNLSNSGIYTGVNTNTLNLTAATSSTNGYQYRCVLNSTCTAPANSNAATLTINIAPSITTQPTNSTICDGNNTSFTIAANGSGVTYQWQVDNGSGWSNLSNSGIYSGVTTATLSLTAASNIVSGYQYRCVVGGSCIPGVNSNAVTLTVNSLPVINSQPINSTICSGSNTSFTTLASGTGLTYQWQVNTGSGWSNVNNTGIYTGATTNTLNLTSVTVAANNDQYRCIVSGTCTPNVTSNAVTLTINSAPAITSQPTNSTLCEYGVTSFSISASGAGVTYQWQVNTGSGWSNITNGGYYSNATTNTLTLTAVTASISGNQYRCVVGGTCILGVNSNTATLTVNTAPLITNHPNSAIICSGDNVTYSVEATGTNLSYQWQVNTGSGWNNLSNTGIYSGTTTDTLRLTSATTAINSYQYRCTINGTCTPSVSTNAANIIVNTAPSISNQPSNSTICEGGNTSFSIAAAGTNLTYQWQVNTGSGWNNLTNTGIYTGIATNTLNLTAVTTSVNNNQYRCAIGGTCLPGVSSNSVTLTINTAPAISTSPTNKTICAGNNTTFSTIATGTNLTYQWQVNNGTGWVNITNTGIYSGVMTNTLSLTSIPASYNNYNYRCVVSGTCTPSATTSLAVLTINNLPAITIQPSNQTICVGNNTSFTAAGTGTGITYQWQVNTGSGWSNINNTGVYSNATTSTLNITNATTAINGAQYRCVLSGTCPPAVNTNPATLTVNSLPTIVGNPNNSVICDGNNTSFGVSATGTSLTYQWQVNTGSGWNNISNNSVYSNATTATLNLTAPNTTYNGNQYRCVVSGYCSPSVISTVANLTVHPIVTPTVNITSTATTICAGTSVTFSVSSISNSGSNPSYQWKKNGSNVGSNATSYTTTGLANGDVITCVMTTTAPCPTSPTATSNAITMTVNPLLLPVINITSSTGDSVCATRLATFTASIVNGGTAPIYQWKINGVNVGTNSDTFSISSLNDGDVITCQLTSNALCATPKVVTSNSIKMKVIPLSFSTAQIHATPNDTICKDDKVVVYCYYTNGGANPTFDWYLNGNKITNPFGSYSTTNFADGDTVHCIFTNGNVCPEPVVTNTETIRVFQSQTSSVSISASSGNVIAPGWTVTFTATPNNPGPNPTYAWRKNGQFISGVTGPTYTDSDLKFGDKIDAVLKADWTCKVNEYAISNTLIVNIPTGVNNINNDGYSLTLFPNPNRGTFMLRGQFGNTNQKAKISVINSLGQKVFINYTELNSGELNYQLRMTDNATGMYMLSIEVDGQVYHKRFNIIE